MYSQTQTWERTLLSMATEARLDDSVCHRPKVDEEILEQAYRHCTIMTSKHSRSFYLASSLLPKAKRRAVRALYAFCRTTDDIVDRATGNRQEQLSAWRQSVLSHHPPETNLVAIAWADARLRYHIPLRYAEQLIDGVERDLVQNRYETFADLAAYCYGVASTVGLMSMHIVGFSGPEAIPYAIKLGVALQITNILRDVAEDWRAGRVYLPQTDLVKFGLNEVDIAKGIQFGVVNEPWREFMRYQIERNRCLYEEALPGVSMLNSDGRFAIATAAELYRSILNDIELHDYNVFTRRAYVSTLGKLRRLPSVWWHC